MVQNIGLGSKNDEESQNIATFFLKGQQSIDTVIQLVFNRNLHTASYDWIADNDPSVFLSRILPFSYFPVSSYSKLHTQLTT